MNFKNPIPARERGKTILFCKSVTPIKELGIYEEALKYLNQAFEIASRGNPTPYRIYVLMALGNLYNLKGEYQKSAEYYEQTLTLLKSGIDATHKTRYLIMIIQDYYRAGEVQKALDLINEVLTFSR